MTPRPEDAPAAIAATPAALRATAVATTAAACSPPGDQSTSTPTTTDAKWGQIRPSRWGQRKSSFSSVYRSAASYAVIRTTRSFDGGDLESSFRLKLLCLSGAVVLLGALSMIRPAHHRVIGLLAGLAMTAQVVVIAIELNSSDLSHAAFQNPNVDNFVAQFSSAVYVAAFVASGGGALIWLALAALSTNHKVCPDCASRVQRSAINCPHCDYAFPLQSGLKRCEECRRPVSSEALVCRHCKHRFGAAPASAA